MRKLIILFLILSLSGCGIFKKTSKVTNRSDSSVRVDSSNRTNIKEKADFVGLWDSTLDIWTIVYADQIKLNPDGTIEAIGEASAGQLRSEDNKGSISGVTSKETIEQSKYSKQEKEKERHTEKASEPDQKAVGNLVRWLVAAGFLLIIVVIFMRKFTP